MIDASLYVTCLYLAMGSLSLMFAWSVTRLIFSHTRALSRDTHSV